MAVEVGIWLDKRTAHLVILEDKKPKVIIVNSEVETRRRDEGEGKQYTRFGDQFSVDEKGKQNRVDGQIQNYFSRIEEEIPKGAVALVLFGPAEIKLKFEKYLSNREAFRSLEIQVEDAHQMTDNQKRAYVEAHFKA